MCGIAGFCNFNIDLRNKKWDESLTKMKISLKNRGGDAFGSYIDKNIRFCHSRLSIRDLSENGNQPLVKVYKNNQYIIVYNGEIYNEIELKIDLEKKGYIFTTKTDTEVILNAFIEYREKCVEYLNGIFAFAIYDESSESLYLFRDRVGIKPLFYTIKDETLVFGSEIKAIFEHSLIDPEINTDSLKQIFGIGPARIEGSGIFKDIHEINTGCFAVYNKEGFKEYKYWKLESKEHKDNYSQTIEKVRFLVKDSIERQLVSDVAVCTFLSGGIDSSIVTAISANYLKNNYNIKLNTFSFDFKDNDIHFKSNAFQPEQDRPYVDIMLRNYDLNHTYLECDENYLIELLYKSVDAKDLPGMTDIDASMLYFCSLVKKHNKVVLTGECADEIFGGYPWFYREDLLNAKPFPWSRDISARTILLKDDLIKKLDLENFATLEYEKSVKETPYLYGETKEETRRREISYLNIKWFMSTLLERMDRTSMYSGLEARVPFADHRIIEYLWNVPWDMKYKDGIEKHLLREACKDFLPAEVLNRKKSPYPKTYNPNYEKLLIDKLSELLQKNSIITEVVDKNKAFKFMESPSNYGRPWFGQLMAGPQMIAYLIQINYWLEKFNLSINI